MAAEQFSGTLASYSFLKENKGWRNYDLVFQDGSSYKDVGIGPSNKVELKPGVTLNLFKTKFSWRVGEDDAPQQSTPQPTNSKPSASFKESKDEWNQYQINERDPKIERQTYINGALHFYAACIPFLEKKPKDSREIDALYNDAVAKGDAEYQRAITKKA